MLDPELEKKLLYILHRGFVEGRLLALGKKHQQLFDLTDAFEPIPLHMAKWTPTSLEEIKSLLQTYREKYPITSFSYLQFLDTDTINDYYP